MWLPLMRSFPASSWASRSRLAGAFLLLLAGGLAVFLAWSISPAPWGLTAYGRFMATYTGRMAPGHQAGKTCPRRAAGRTPSAPIWGRGSMARSP